MKNKKPLKKYESRCARDARKQKYGDESYWDMLEESALRHSKYYRDHGLNAMAKKMLTRTLGEALSGNDGQ